MVCAWSVAPLLLLTELTELNVSCMYKVTSTHPCHIRLGAMNVRGVVLVLLAAVNGGSGAIGSGGGTCVITMRAGMLPCLRMAPRLCVQLAQPLHRAGHLIQTEVGLCWPKLQVEKVEGLPVSNADRRGVALQAARFRAGALHAHCGRRRAAASTERTKAPPKLDYSASRPAKPLVCPATCPVVRRTARSAEATLASVQDRVQISNCGPAREDASPKSPSHFCPLHSGHASQTLIDQVLTMRYPACRGACVAPTLFGAACSTCSLALNDQTSWGAV
jgi:hypothetical protein